MADSVAGPFRRRDRTTPPGPQSPPAPESAPSDSAAGTGAGDQQGGRSSLGGPYDAGEVPERSGYLDLGAVAIPASGPDTQIQLQVDQANGTVSAVLVTIGGGMLEVSAFAAARSEGIWDEVRREIAAGLSTQGGVCDEESGPFGTELRVQLPAKTPDGKNAVRPLRFVGIDGPRWFLRGVLSGQAALDPAAADPLERLFAGVVVDRGSAPMAPRAPLPMRMPPLPGADQPAPGSEGSGGEGSSGSSPLQPFERGPEITETR